MDRKIHSNVDGATVQQSCLDCGAISSEKLCLVRLQVASPLEFMLADGTLSGDSKLGVSLDSRLINHRALSGVIRQTLLWQAV